jgi:hypothetical protein
VVWVVVAAIDILVGAAYLAGRRRARQVLAGGVPWSRPCQRKSGR